MKHIATLLTITLAFLMILAVQIRPAAANLWDQDFKLSEIAGVEVKLVDDAKKGCWTNLREVREYTEEKLRMKGAKILNLGDKNPLAVANTYNFQIHVNADRVYANGSGHCYASYNIRLYTFELVNGNYHAAVAGAYLGLALLDNLNRDVLEFVNKFINELN